MNAVLVPETEILSVEGFTLTEDQQNVLQVFVSFLADPVKKVLRIEGYAGTGKSTLIKTLLDRLPSYGKMLRLVDPEFKMLPIQLTATTNKAAEALSHMSGMDVQTIHSFLGLRVDTDHLTGQTGLVPRANAQQFNMLVFIDEASYVDSQLLGLIFSQTVNCKIVFIGDRAQLAPVKSSGVPPVFLANFESVMLTEVVRQKQADGSTTVHPITELATMFRNAVNTGVWGTVNVDGQHIIHLPRDTFEDQVLAEFTRPDWRYNDSKVLAWTNKCVINYNHALNNHIKGTPSFQEGDYAVCNKFVSANKHSLKTDQMVCITGIEPDNYEHNVLGSYVTVDHAGRYFFPKSLEAKKERLKTARANNDWKISEEIDRSWIDLRAAFAQTTNKSQGSTYDKVYIDLDDIRRCNSGDQLARMMYVGTSRARHQVIMTGDLA